MEDKSAVFSNTRNQYLASLSAFITFLIFGCMVGWASPALPLLSSEKDPILETGAITTEESSWIGSVFNLGCVLGTLSFGYVVAMIGSKQAMYYISIPSMACWLLILFGQNVLLIFIARILAGYVSGAAYACTLPYIAEIADNNIRGTLNTIGQVLRNVGVLIGYIIGSQLNYWQVPLINLTLPVIFLLCNLCFPNTPQELIRRGRLEEAKKSLKFYKGCKGDNEKENIALDAEFKRLVSLSMSRKSEEQFRFKYLCEKKIIKKCINVLALIWFSQLCGSYTFMTYAVSIFELSGAHFSPNVSSMMLAVVQIFGALLAAYFVDRLGRKILMSTSLVGCTAGLSAMAAYLYLSDNGFDLHYFSWVPVTSLAVVIFISNFGVLPLSMVYLTETMPIKVRGFTIAVGNAMLNVIAFSVAKLFPIMTEKFNLYSCMGIFAINCAVGAFFVAIAIEETMGKDLEAEENDEKTSKNISRN